VRVLFSCTDSRQGFLPAPKTGSHPPRPMSLAGAARVQPAPNLMESSVSQMSGPWPPWGSRW